MSSTGTSTPAKSELKSLLNNPRFHLALAAVNGALYFFIAREGGSNLQQFFGMHGSTAKTAIAAISVGAALVYTMFTYKTLEAIKLRPTTLAQGFFFALAPFSASAFLAGGFLGAQLMGFSEASALVMGGALFALRLLNCFDASVKFPSRLAEVATDWKTAIQTRNCGEITRSVVTALTTVLYSACATDAVYSATDKILGLAHVAQSTITPIAYTASALGAIGTAPLILYWVQRGLRQLFDASKHKPALAKTDPTDKFTYIGLALVIPVILGILGSATAASGHVFGRLGNFAEYSRIGSSVIYACCAGTPGMATLLRTVFKANATLEKPLLGKDSTSVQREGSGTGSDSSTSLAMMERGQAANQRTQAAEAQVEGNL